MDEPQAIVQPIRVLGTDTIEVRAWCPMTRQRSSLFVTPCGVSCGPEAGGHIVDWCETHAHSDNAKLVPFDYLRDEYGRLLCDLADYQTGETLTAYLLSVGCAHPRPGHLHEALGSMMSAKEVDDVEW